MKSKSCLLSHFDRVDALIWDWNGTLLDDVKVNMKVINEMLSRRGLKSLDLVEYKQLFCFPVKRFHVQIGFDFEKESIEDISTEYMNLYKKYERETELHADVSFVLDAINSRGVDQYILSAAGQDDLLAMLDYFHLSGKFKGVYGSDDICANGKIGIGQKLIKENSLNPLNVLLVGDTLHDVEVAKSLGVKCVCYSEGHNCIDILSEKSAVITGLRDVLSFVDVSVGDK